jgi:tetratricopeptide (TPR) repeat protein
MSAYAGDSEMTERQTSKRAAAAMALGLLLAGAGAAQNIARVNFMVSLPDGQPVEGVEITVTSRDRPGFEQRLKTSKRGEALFAVNDTDHDYQVAVKYADYELVEIEVRPRASETVVRRIVLSSSGEAPPASSELSAAAGLRPAEARFNEGVEAAMKEDYAAAKAKFLEAVELDPDLAPAHQALSGLLLDEKDYAAAARHAARAAELDPKNTRAYRVLYEAHTQLGDEAAAAEALAKLGEVGQSSVSADVIFNEGVAALREGDAATAKANFEKALELQSDLLPAVSALAVVYLHEESSQRAAEMAERFLATDAGDPQMLRVRWKAYRGLGDAAKEKAAFDAFAAGNPEALATELFNAGAELFDTGDAQGARESFETVLEIDPGHPRGHYQLALCLVQLGDAEGARKHFSRFIELAPDDPEAATAKEMLTYVQQ